MRCRSKFGWMELMIGILLIVLGIFTFLRPGSVLTGRRAGLRRVRPYHRDCGYCVLCEDGASYRLRAGSSSGQRHFERDRGFAGDGLSRRRGLGADDLLPPMVHHALHLPPDPLGDHPVCGRQRVLLFQPDPEHHRGWCSASSCCSSRPSRSCPWALSSGPI